MKKVIAFFVMLQITLLCVAQYNANLFLVSSSNVSGLLSSSPVLNITVSRNAAPMFDFNFAQDLENGKEIPLFYRIEVSSEVPWVITANANKDFFTALYMQSVVTNNNIPVSIVSLKNNNEQIYLPLGVVGRPILMGNATTNSIFFIDMKMNPSWNYAGGVYNVDVNFNIARQ